MTMKAKYKDTNTIQNTNITQMCFYSVNSIDRMTEVLDPGIPSKVVMLIGLLMSGVHCHLL